MSEFPSITELSVHPPVQHFEGRNPSTDYPRAYSTSRRSKDMSVTQRRGAEFNNYPQLNAEEFGEICHQLDRRYSQATLGPVRRRWKLRVCRALDISLTASAEYTTFVQIIRPLDGELDDGDLSACLDNFSFAEADNQMTSTEDHEMLEAEESDSVRRVA